MRLLYPQFADSRPVWKRVFFVLCLLASVGNLFGQNREHAELLQWIRENEGECDCEGADQSVVVLRLDRTRGIDPGFALDKIGDEELKILELMPGIRELTLEGRHAITDRSFSHIATLKHLRKLNLTATSVSGAAFESLAHLPLHDVDLSNCPKIGDAEIASLKHLTKLTKLQLNAFSEYWMSDDGWTQQISYELQSASRGPSSSSQLNAYRSGITDAGLKHIGELSELRNLSLVRTRISDEGLEALTQLSNLSELDLSGTAITDKGLVHIGRLSKLKTLRLNLTYITDAGLGSLARLVDLETLDIRGTQVSAEGLRRLLGCTKLRRLDIAGANRSNGLIDVLKEFHQLDELRLKGTAVSFRELVELCRALPTLSLRKVILASSFNDSIPLWDQNGEETITALQLSNLARNGSVGDGCIQDDDLAFLREQHLLDELRVLELNNTQVSNSGMQHLEGLEELHGLSLNNTSVTDAGLVHLRESRKLGLLPIRETRLSLGGIVDLVVNEQHRSLIEALQVAGLVIEYNPKELPLSLDMHSARLTDADLVSLVPLDVVDTLLLDDNPISDIGLATLAQFKHVRQLWVSGELITGPGLVSLKRLTSLETLWLTDTRAIDTDLLHLAELPRLRVLNLSGMKFTANASKHLRALESLEELIVDSGALSDSDLKEIQDANPRLSIILSQKRALAAVRGRERSERRLPQGYHRGLEMRCASSTVIENPLVSVFGDVYFEQAEALEFANKTVRLPRHWQELKTLKTISLDRSLVSSNDLAELGRLPMLRELRMREARIPEDAFVHLGKLTNLESLSLGGYGTEIHDTALEHIKKLHNLKQLDLSRTKITDSGMVHLQQLHRLEQLSLREVAIDGGISRLGQLPNLRELDLYSTLVTDASLIPLYGLPNVRRISLENTFVTEDGVNQLRMHLPDASVQSGVISEESRKVARHLGRLRVPMYRNSRDEVFMADLRGRDDIAALMTHVLNLKGLLELHLDMSATKGILGDVMSISSLEKLNLSGCDISDSALSKIHQLQHLKELYLQSCTVGDDTLRQLQHLPELRFLWLGSAKFPDGIGALNCLTKLEGLSFNATAVGDEDLAHLVELTGLKSLFLDSTPISKAALVQLDKLPNLEILSLQNTAIVPRDVIAFQKLHPKCKVCF